MKGFSSTSEDMLLYTKKNIETQNLTFIDEERGNQFLVCQSLPTSFTTIS